jgi:hypothetical protein
MPEPGTGDKTPIQSKPEPKPISPSPATEGQQPRSRIYSEEKLRNDYSLFTGKEPGAKTIAEVQKELYDLLSAGEVEDENQAFEWLLGRKWSEFDDDDRSVIRQFASDEGKRQYGHIWKLG